MVMACHCRTCQILKAGTLDDPSQITPNAHIWCSETQPWVELPADAACFDQGPE